MKLHRHELENPGVFISASFELRPSATEPSRVSPAFGPPIEFLERVAGGCRAQFVPGGSLPE